MKFLNINTFFIYRLFADIINDAAIFLEIMGPHFPDIFTFIICVSGVLKVSYLFIAEMFLLSLLYSIL